MRLISVLGVMLLSCSEGQFSSNNANGSQPETEELVEVSENIQAADQEVILEVGSEGIAGGHFDLDTSTEIYEFDDGQTDGHVHEYDDKYQLNGANFFDLKDKKLSNINTQLLPGQRFRLIVGNASLSPLGYIKVNDSQMNVVDFQSEYNGKSIYSLNEMDGTDPLKGLQISFPKDVLAKSGLIATATGCVRSNQMGKNGEYRNGALVIQAVDADDYSLDANTGLATSGLLWEASLFWHKDNNCFL